MADSLADRLRQIAEAQGLGTAEFAARAGLKYRSAQDYLRGVSKPGADALEKVCTEFRVDGTWLLTGIGQMSRPSRTDAVLNQIQAETEAYVAREIAAERSALSPQVRELHDAVHRHLSMAMRMCAKDSDFPALLAFIAWLLNWWEAVGHNDHAWLLGQIDRHIPDWNGSLEWHQAMTTHTQDDGDTA